MRKLHKMAGLLIGVLAAGTSYAQVPTDIQPGPGSTSNCIRANQVYTLSTSMTWSTPGTHYINSTFRVATGNTLTISDGTYRLAQGVEIYVQRGAQLIVEGSSTVITSCDDVIFWGGIDVRGESSAVQTSTNYGTVLVSDGATIRNAEVGIEQYEGCNEGGGGIIKVEDALFLNNIHSIKFREYDDDISYVKGTDFLIDDTFENKVSVAGCGILPTVGHQVMLDHNNGVEIRGCHFMNHYNLGGVNTPIWSFSNHFGAGIYANESQFVLAPIDDAIEVPCNYPEGRGNYFYGWYYGVATFFTQRIGNTFEVTGSHFENNRDALWIRGVDNVTIVDNIFEVNDALADVFDFHTTCGTSHDSPNTSGIALHHETTNLRVIGNEFLHQTTQNITNFSGVYYVLQAPFNPTSMAFQGNNFVTAINQTGPIAVASSSGIVIDNLTSTENIVLECNNFDLASGINWASVSNHRLHDIVVHNDPGTNVNLMFNSNLDKNQNTWSNFPVCAVPTLNVAALNIWATGGTYSYTTHDPVMDNPACNQPVAGVTVVPMATQCPAPSDWDFCYAFPDGLQAQVQAPGNTGAGDVLDDEAADALLIYPNPTGDALSIETHQRGQTRIFSVHGQEVLQQQLLNAGQSTIDVSALPAGIYFLEFQSEEGTTTSQFVKK